MIDLGFYKFTTIKITIYKHFIVKYLVEITKFHLNKSTRNILVWVQLTHSCQDLVRIFSLRLSINFTFKVITTSTVLKLYTEVTGR